jgi:hypothetical protein
MEETMGTQTITPPRSKSCWRLFTAPDAARGLRRLPTDLGGGMGDERELVCPTEGWRVEHEDPEVRLYGGYGAFSIPAQIWLSILSLAILYGWTPTGTSVPEEESALSGGWSPAGSEAPAEERLPGWDGRYYPTWQQEIIESDARALADALERALPDIPSEDLLIGDCRYQDPEGEGWRIDNPPPGTTPNPLRSLSGGNRAWLQDLVVHLREPGGCVIG